MRMMLQAVLDTDAGNEALRNGSLPKVVEQIVEQLKPEAVYFTPMDGQRGLVAVFDMSDAAQLPVLTEPLFLGGRARVTVSPCMNLDDLQRGLGQLPAELTLAGA